MNPLIVLPAIVVVAILFVVVPVAASAVSRVRGAWRVRCPEDAAEAEIGFDTLDTACAELTGRPGPRVAHCSSWPERLGCAQACLAGGPAAWSRPALGDPSLRRGTR